MTKMERVVTALSHKEPDRVPVYPILSGVSRLLVGADYPTWSRDAEVCANALIKAADDYELDCIVTLIDLSVEADAWGVNVIYPESEAAHPDFANPVIKEPEDYKKIKYVDYRKSERMQMHIDVCKKIVEKKGGELPIVAFVFGPLGTLSMLRNQQDMYMDLYDEPELVKDAAHQVALTLADYCDAIMDTGVNGIMLDTLFASGSIMSKEQWREFESDEAKMLSERIRAKNGLVFIHNCGDKIYFDAQIDSMHPDGISFLYPPDDCKDYKECKAKYGDKTTLIGCALPANVVISSAEQWEAECKKNIDDMAEGGGFILATGCEYPANALLDKAKQMAEIAKTYGKY